MWHELVLCGIGGCTIAEAKNRISYTEFLQWLAYRNLRGSLNLGMRIERGSALLATIYANAHRKKDVDPFALDDFMPHADQKPITLDKALKEWQ